MQPVTTNPFLIMAINMAIVFFVLWILGYVIRFIHYIDPMKEKIEETKKNSAASIQNEVDYINRTKDESEEEVVAAITAAIVEYGYQADEFKIESIEEIK